MTSNIRRAADSKHKREALNVADFKIDDILNVPGDQLLAEVAEDFGDPAFLAAQFDSIALSARSSDDIGRVNRPEATVRLPAAPGMVSVRAFPQSPRTSFSGATPAQWPVVLSRRRVFFGTFAALLLVAVLAHGIYPLLLTRSPDRITSVAQHEPPAPASSPPLPEGHPAGSAVAPAHVLQQPSSAERSRTVPDVSENAAGLAPDRQASPLPGASFAPRARAPQVVAAPPAAGRTLPAAKPRATERHGFFVELSAPNSEPEALSTLRALKSKYTVLKGYELEIRPKDERERGLNYTVQVGPFGSQNDAEELCKQLRTAGGICLVTRD